MDLAEHQAKLAGLLKGSYRTTADDDPYLACVEGSRELALVREIRLWWRSLGVGKVCPLTSALLRRQGRFDDALARFVASWKLSSYIEELGEAFLSSTATDEDPLLAALATFELALVRAGRHPESRPETVIWDRDPARVLSALLNGTALPERDTARFITHVSPALPNLFEIAAS